MADLILSEKDRLRFFKYLERRAETGCLVWTGKRNAWGYGQFSLRGRHVQAHRVAFVNAGGVLTPQRPFVLHTCPGGDNPACCEVSHLRAGNNSDNMHDRVRAGKGSKSSSGMPFGVYRSSNRFRAAPSKLAGDWFMSAPSIRLRRHRPPHCPRRAYSPALALPTSSRVSGRASPRSGPASGRRWRRCGLPHKTAARTRCSARSCGRRRGARSSWRMRSSPSWPKPPPNRPTWIGGSNG
jgi:hypothetical protein